MPLFCLQPMFRVLTSKAFVLKEFKTSQGVLDLFLHPASAPRCFFASNSPRKADGSSAISHLKSSGKFSPPPFRGYSQSPSPPQKNSTARPDVDKEPDPPSPSWFSSYVGKWRGLEGVKPPPAPPFSHIIASGVCIFPPGI